MHKAGTSTLTRLFVIHIDSMHCAESGQWAWVVRWP